MTSAGNDGTIDELHGAVDRLVHEFAGVYARETVAECVHDSRARLGVQRIKTYEALLAYRYARQRLQAGAVVSGLLPRDVPEVLIVCTHNAGRSQLAAALLEQRAGGRVSVHSAGTLPAPDLHPGVREALAKVGADAADAFPKPLTDEFVAAADVVVTMGCGDACPVVPGRRYVDWDLPDPEGAGPDELRRIRDEVSARVDLLLHELLSA